MGQPDDTKRSGTGSSIMTKLFRHKSHHNAPADTTSPPMIITGQFEESEAELDPPARERAETPRSVTPIAERLRALVPPSDSLSNDGSMSSLSLPATPEPRSDGRVGYQRSHSFISSPAASRHASVVNSPVNANHTGWHLPSLQSTSPISLPSSQNHTPTPALEESSEDLDVKPPLKIKLVSWNMNQMTPKGDLTMLLGPVPDFDPLQKHDMHSCGLPNLPTDDIHPYHLVVVSTQECPTLSGLPRGIGGMSTMMAQPSTSSHGVPALNPHHSNQSKEIVGWSAMLEDWLCHGGGNPNRSDKTQREKAHARDRLHSESAVDLTTIPDLDFLESPPLQPSNASSPDLSSPDENGKRLAEPVSLRSHHNQSLDPHFHHPDTSSSQALHNQQEAIRDKVSSKTTKPPLMRKFSKAPKHEEGLSGKDTKHRMAHKGSGMYELLSKERLMGISTMIFVYRGAKNAVDSSSKGAVTAGLLGGRVGNKGAVGITVKIATTSLLFINVHLAAHEGRMQARLENLEKIRKTLSVDTFLPPGDPRAKEEDITSRSDFTFISGDLNFRVGITRKHADWLILQDEYLQALEWDELRRVMREGRAFNGFHEPEILFQPTYKYDVMRSQVIRKSKSGRHLRNRQSTSSKRQSMEASRAAINQSEMEDDLSVSQTTGMDNSDTVSIRSALTNLTSVHSRRTSYAGSDSDAPTKPNTFKKILGIVSATGHSSHKSSHLSPEISIAAPRPPKTIQAKAVSGIAPSDRPLGLKELKRRLTRAKADANETDSSSDDEASSENPSGDEHNSSSRQEKKQEYDTSRKQRVPSWCDRVLWRTTLKPDVKNEDFLRSGRRVGRLGSAIQNVLRRRSMNIGSGSYSDDADSMFEDLHLATPLEETAPKRDTQAETVGKSVFSWQAKSPTIATYRSDLQQPTANMISDSPTHLEPESSSLPFWKFRKCQPDIYQGVNITDDLRQSQGPLAKTFEPGTEKLGLPEKSQPEPFWKSIANFLTPNTDKESSQTGLPNLNAQIRGEVSCLSYTTLDDQGMLNLEGRSDHRPIISAFLLQNP